MNPFHLLFLITTTNAIVIPSAATPAPPKPFYVPDVRILSASGSGCPSLEPTGDGFSTRVSYGLDINGLKEYYAHITYAPLVVDVTGLGSTRYCDLTLNISAPAEFQVLLGKNGTRQLATYDLDEGVSASWKYTYYVPGDESLIETLTVPGPLHTGNEEVPFNATVPSAPYTFPTCGDVALKLRMEVTVQGGAKGAKGRVDSQREMYQHDAYNGSYAYGVSQGISLHTQKCSQ